MMQDDENLRHQIIGQRRGIGVLIGSAGLVAAMCLSICGMPSRVSTSPIHPVHQRTSTPDDPTVGSLAGNTRWINRFRAQVQTKANVEPGWQVGDASSIRIRFAGDVPEGRAALVTVPLHRGMVDTKLTAVWFEGPANAAPEQMHESTQAVPSRVAARIVGGAKKPGYLIVVAPTGSVIETSLGVVFGADGRAYRDWTRGSATDGLAIVTAPPSYRFPATSVRVTKNGRTLMNQRPTGTWDAKPGMWGVPEALGLARGSTVALALANSWVEYAMNDAALDSGSTQLRIPWTGTVHGDPAALVQLIPAGGGSLFYAFHGTTTWASFDLRLLVPTKGAQTRPIGWRLRADEKNGQKPARGGALWTKVAVVTSPGTARAEVISQKGTTPLSLDENGYAEAQVPSNDQPIIRAYDADGKVLGETVVPAAETAATRQHQPGEDRLTRLVD